MKRRSLVTVLVTLMLLALFVAAFSACGKKDENKDPTAHTHTYASEWSQSDTEHWYAATCEHTGEKKDAEAHRWNGGDVTAQPTEEADGLKTFTCTVCGKTRTESIPALGHEHTYATEWSKDGTHHWHAATCRHTAEVKDKAAHKWNEGEITKAPTATEPGTKTYTCDVCGATKAEDIAALGAQDNTLSPKTGVTLGKTYDGRPVAFTKDMFVYNGDGEVTFAYKAKDAAVFTEDVPSVAGEYVVKVSVAGTSEWKAVEKDFDFIIEKVRLASIEKALEVMYDGATTAFDLTGRITEKVAGDDIKLVVRMTGFAVGSTVNEVMFTGDDAFNYTYDATKLSVTIGRAVINIGRTQYETEFKSGEWKTVFALTGDNGVVKKGGVLEDVSIEILHDNDWANKKSYALYTEDATKASNIECVRLVGADAGNYVLVGNQDGNLDATLDCTIKETQIDAILDPNNRYDWGGIIVDNITFANRELVVGGYQGEITDKLIDDENNFKQLEFVMYVRGTTIKIAEGTRTLWHDADYEHVYTGCVLIPGKGGPANLEISLLKNVDGYTDENGYWICEQNKVELTLTVNENTKPAEANQDLFENGLVQAGYAVVQYKHTEEDASSVRVELTEGATGTVETHVYGFVDGKFAEVKPNGDDYEMNTGETYYIVVLVRTAGTGNVRIVAYN